LEDGMETRTITLTWGVLCSLEPRLALLEKHALAIKRFKDSSVKIEMWRHLYEKLSTTVGWWREDNHPILATKQAWEIAYPYLYYLSRETEG
jgi:hypothetical protein